MVEIFWLKNCVNFIPEKIALKLINIDILTKIVGCLFADGKIFKTPIKDWVHYLTTLPVLKDKLDEFIDVDVSFVEIDGLGEVMGHSSDYIEEIGHLKQEVLVAESDIMFNY